MFSVPLSEVTFEMIEAIIADEVPEGDSVEFKESLPIKKGATPPNGDKAVIGEYARNALIEEVIAFANAYGGTLIVGIRETKDKPARAAKITPLSACHELAEIFRLQCRDVIEPQLPVIEVAGVAGDADGNGVLVVRVPRSRLAPHRHNVTKECYVRRADRTEKMTMREIQDLTLNVERGMAAINARLADFRGLLPAMMSFSGNQKGCHWGLNVCLVPTSPIGVDRVHGIEILRPRVWKFIDRNGGMEIQYPTSLQMPVPILRGTSRKYSDDWRSVVHTVFCDGVINFRLVYFANDTDENRRGGLIFPSWVMAIVGSALCNAERFRRYTASPEVEYAMQIEMMVEGTDAIPVSTYGRNFFNDAMGSIARGTHTFPTYSVGGVTSLSSVMRFFERDFWNAAGTDWDDALDLNIEEVLGGTGS